jgi:hypothetical protein
MPAFTFEKISPPARTGSTKAAPKKPRGMLSQMIDRFAEKRAKRALRDQRTGPRRDDKPAE